MKRFAVALVSFVGLTQAENLANIVPADPLSGDFLTGFESGIFLRQSENEYKEYNCPVAAIAQEDFRKVKDMLPAIKTMMGVMNKGDDEMINMLESLTVFLDHLDELIGVFDQTYSGGDFCAGLTFGYKGSNLLFTIAEDIITKNLASMDIGKK